MKKYKFHELGLEITRRCNKKCAHCLRGEAQNITMTHDMIDKIIDDVEDVFALVLLSGEVLLEIDTIEYLIQKINKSHWHTKVIQFTTNGTILDKRVIDILQTFCTGDNGRYILIRISNDQFHNSEEYTKAYIFYKELIEEANKRIKAINHLSEILLVFTEKNDNKLDHLVYSGNAKKLIDNNENGFSHGFCSNVRYPNKYGHRLKINKNTIPCGIQICANGNISYTEHLDYFTLDEISFGNILHDNLTSIIDKHNDTCMVLCSEVDLMNHVNYGKYYTEYDDTAIPQMYEVQQILYEQVINLRQLAKFYYPNIPASVIIEKIPFPDKEKEILIYLQLHSSCKYASSKAKNAFHTNETDSNFAESMKFLFEEMLYGLKNEVDRKKPYCLFGNRTDKLHWLKQNDFECLEYLASCGFLGNNDKNFYCESVVGLTINYERDKSKLSLPDLDKFIASCKDIEYPSNKAVLNALAKESGMSIEELKKQIEKILEEAESSKQKAFKDFVERYKIR